MFPTIKQIKEFLEAHGLQSLVGALSILAAITWALADKVNLAAGTPTLTKDAVAAAGPAFLTFVGIALLVHSRHKDLREAAGPLADQELQGRITLALGTVSLSERNEEARETIACLLELVNYVDAGESNKTKISMHQTLEVLHAFLSVGKDDFAPSSFAVRGSVDELLQKGNSKGFEHPSVRLYLQGIKALTYLLEGYQGRNAQRALALLTATVDELRQLERESRFGLSTMLNAKGVCHGILSGDPELDMEQSLSHLVLARDSFEMQMDSSVVMEKLSAGVQYRCAVNKAELMANAFWTWKSLPGDRQGDALRRLEPFVEVDKRGSQASFFFSLFRKMADELEFAKQIAGDQRARGIKRPAVWNAAFIASVAFTHARSLGVVENNFTLATLRPREIPSCLDRLVGELRNEMLASDIISYLQYSPIVAEGLVDADHSDLQTARASLARLISNLEKLPG